MKIYVVVETIDDYDFMTSDGELIEYRKGSFSTPEKALQAVETYVKSLNDGDMNFDEAVDKPIKRIGKRLKWTDGYKLIVIEVEELDKEIE